MKCLVVEDNAAVRQAIADLVAEVADVVTAPDPVQAIALLSQCPVDLLLTDYSLPEMTGAQLIAVVKARWPKTKTIMISAHDELAQSLSTEIIFIAKPFDSDLLLTTLAKIEKEV